MINGLRRLGRVGIAALSWLGRANVFLLHVLMALPSLLPRPSLVIAQTYATGVLVTTHYSGIGIVCRHGVRFAGL